MTLSKREDTGNRKRKHQIALHGNLALEGAMELLYKPDYLLMVVVVVVVMMVE
jgi:hypothetical protein